MYHTVSHVTCLF